jgi:hypothetical protein
VSAAARNAVGDAQLGKEDVSVAIARLDSGIEDVDRQLKNVVSVPVFVIQCL